jgi:hypothetical protein
MRKRQKFTSITNVVEVSDEEYRRLAAEASMKMRAEAKKNLPRSERNKTPVEASLVSDEEYEKLARSSRVPKSGAFRPSRKRRSTPSVSDETSTEISPEEYRRLAEELMNRTEARGRRQDQFLGILRGVVHPITIAIIVFSGICIYFLYMHNHLNAF